MSSHSYVVSTAILHWILPRPTSAYHIKPQPTLSHLPTPSYSVAYCHSTSQKTQSYSFLPQLTTSYIVLHYILLTSYPVLPSPTTANYTLQQPTLLSPASLPCPSLSYSILHQPTPPYTVAYCHPNLVLHCFFCAATLYNLILPHQTTAYPIVFYCHPTSHPTLSQLTTQESRAYLILPSLTHPTTLMTRLQSLSG